MNTDTTTPATTTASLLKNDPELKAFTGYLALMYGQAAFAFNMTYSENEDGSVKDRLLINWLDQKVIDGKTYWYNLDSYITEQDCIDMLTQKTDLRTTYFKHGAVITKIGAGVVVQETFVETVEELEALGFVVSDPGVMMSHDLLPPQYDIEELEGIANPEERARFLKVTGLSTDFRYTEDKDGA